MLEVHGEYYHELCHTYGVCFCCSAIVFRHHLINYNAVVFQQQLNADIVVLQN